MLTDEQMHEAFLSIAEDAAHTSFEEFMEDGDARYIRAYARAIESAACAERDARIKELERQLAEARNQALEDAAKCCDDLRSPWGYSAENADWIRGTDDCAHAIRSMKKEQT